MMVGGGVDEELAPEESRPVDEWPPPTSNLEQLANKDGSSSRLLFLTVQYVGEEAGASFNTGLESFPELGHRVVSPLDPNMGCTACYSPVYRPSSPLMPAPGQESAASGVYNIAVSPSEGYLTTSPPPPESGMIVLSDQCQFSAGDNYVVADTSRLYQEQVTAEDQGKLLLPTELVVAGAESCQDQRVELLLSNGTIAYGIVESADNTGTRVIQIPREYLVTAPTETSDLPVGSENLQNENVHHESDQDHNGQDDSGHMRALYDTLKEQGLIIEPGELKLGSELGHSQALMDTELLDQTALLQDSQYLVSAAQQRFWCEECNKLLDKTCRAHQINRKIIDKAVPSRARATLPASYLAINKLLGSFEEDYGVFARKYIPKRTQFGPIEGVIKSDCVLLPQEGRQLQLTIETETGELRTLDVSNEHMSNWMRFVRMASADQPPNLLLSQLGASLFFTTTHTIHPRQELLVWYSPAYALRRSLPSNPPTPEWPCQTCGEKLKTCEELTKHANCHKINPVLFEDIQEFLYL